MGCYMSRPNDEVIVTEGKGRNFTYATASCQGWRRDQEDAEACIPDFDENASLFILCDGHGGAEVAKYTVKHFPTFLKEHKLYKEGDYVKALEKAFVEFDASLRSPAKMKELQRLALEDDEPSEEERAKDAAGSEPKPEPSGLSSGAGPSAGSSSAGPSTSNGARSVADDVDVDTLRKEAMVPLEELISKYANKDTTNRILKLGQVPDGRSPAIKSKDHEGASSSNTEAPSSSSHLGGDEDEYQLTGPDDERKVAFLNSLKDCFFSGDSLCPEDEDFDSDFDEKSEESDSEDDGDDDDEDDDGDDECDEDTQGEKSKSKKLLNKKQRRSVVKRDDSSSEDDSEDDTSPSGSEEEEEEDIELEDGVHPLDDSDDYEDIAEEGDEKAGNYKGPGGKISRKMFLKNVKASKIHRPAMDSGCTVVVALLKDDRLYVANAGDSRCIVVTEKSFAEMSLDHKPDDVVEYKRIVEAGGQVVDGRVNGGLNLSRAFGDFTYKNPRLFPWMQMITAHPDITNTNVESGKVDFIFLACDGIWNSLKSETVAKFIRRNSQEKKDLVENCMAIFKRCLAPSTDGDGTGCDNMTCILVQFNRSSEKESSTTNESDLKVSATNDDEKCSDEPVASSKPQGVKRSAEEDTGDNNKIKRRCLKLLPEPVPL